MKADEKMVAQMMKALDCTREEALELIAEDEAVDKMTTKEVNADLTADQKKAVKKATATGSKKRAPVKRERKIDAVKGRLLNDYRVLLEGLGAQVEPLKTEAEMHFTFEGASYTVKLIKHRPPKA